MPSLPRERCGHPAWMKERTLLGEVCRACHPRPRSEYREVL